MNEKALKNWSSLSGANGVTIKNLIDFICENIPKSDWSKRKVQIWSYEKKMKIDELISSKGSNDLIILIKTEGKKE